MAGMAELGWRGLQDRLEEYHPRCNIKRFEGPVVESIGNGEKQTHPGDGARMRTCEGYAEIIGQKGSLRYTQEARNVILDGDWCIEEVEIIFIKVKGHSSCIHKVNENEIEFGGFLSSQIV